MSRHGWLYGWHSGWGDAHPARLHVPAGSPHSECRRHAPVGRLKNREDRPVAKNTNGNTAAEKPVLNGIDGGAAAEPAAAKERSLDPAVLAQIAAFKTRMQASIGEVVLAMMNLPRYRYQTLADVMHLVVEPMTRDRIAIARAGGEGKVEETAGIAIWASVSDEVDAKIREQIQAR